MFISEEKANSRLSSENNVADKYSQDRNPRFVKLNEAELRPMHNGGRRPGDKNVPDFIREAVGTLAHVDKAKNIAREFDLSQSSISAYKVGAVSTDSYHEPDPTLKIKVESNLDKIVDIAVEKLIDSMNLIEPVKLKSASVRDLAGVASSMSKIIDRARPKEVENRKELQIIFYSPKVNVEGDYQVLNVTKESSE